MAASAWVPAIIVPQSYAVSQERSLCRYRWVKTIFSLAGVPNCPGLKTAPGRCAARPWVVLVEGPPGAGKTALLRHWLSREDREDVTLLRAYGDAAEADSSFGLVGQLIARVSGEQLHGFPLLRDGIPPASASSTQVAGQLLRLFDDLQAGGPVAVVIEDAQWADNASCKW